MLVRESPKATALMVDDGRQDALLYGFLFAGAVAAFCLKGLVDSRFTLTSDALAIVGGATCGWSWLSARALFRPPMQRQDVWPLILVLALVAVGALPQSGDAAFLPRMIGNAAGLASSAVLLLAMIEPLRGLTASAGAERGFRIVFAGGYAAMLGIAVLWIDGAPAGSFADRSGPAIKAACALLALAGMGLAIWYRSRNPLPQAGGVKRQAVIDEDGLGARILDVMKDQSAFVQSGLKVADVARRLGAPEYKVTRCITGPLGFRNFNHMANHFRIAEAKRRLADARLAHLPVLTIALDCGFGSIGPFNRAFKAETGMTPKHFRTAGGA